jgi:hypothetical protein
MSLPAAPLALSGGDRAELDRLARSGDRRMAERARIILACADSADRNSGVAGELGLFVEDGWLGPPASTVRRIRASRGHAAIRCRRQLNTDQGAANEN